MNPANIMSIIVIHYKHKRRSTDITVQERNAAAFIINVIDETVETNGKNIQNEHTIDYIEEYEYAEEDLSDCEELIDDPEPDSDEELVRSDGSQSSAYVPSPPKRKKWADISFEKAKEVIAFQDSGKTKRLSFKTVQK